MKKVYTVLVVALFMAGSIFAADVSKTVQTLGDYKEALAAGLSVLDEGDLVFFGDSAGISAVSDLGRVAVHSDTGISYSDDSGVTWTPYGDPGYNNVTYFYISDDNKVLAVIKESAIYISSDYGVTWAEKYTGDVGMFSMTTDGSTMYFSEGTQNIRSSTDYGDTWNTTAIVGIPFFYIFGMSKDGEIVVVENNDVIYISTDSGANFTNAGSIGNGTYYYTSISDDHTKIMMHGAPGLYTSTDSGATWSHYDDTADKLRAPIMSADGSTIVAGRQLSKGLVASYDMGVTWTEISDADYYFTFIDITTDGMSFTASSLSPDEPLAIKITTEEPVVIDLLQAGQPLSLGSAADEGSWRLVWTATEATLQVNQAGVWNTAETFTAP